MSTAVHHWREWAILKWLYENAVWERGKYRYVGTGAIRYQVGHQGWPVFRGDLSRSNQTARTRASLKKLEERGHVESLRAGDERKWKITDLGHDFVKEYIINNPNITIEKCRKDLA